MSTMSRSMPQGAASVQVRMVSKISCALVMCTFSIVERPKVEKVIAALTKDIIDGSLDDSIFGMCDGGLKVVRVLVDL